jgi:hypothetical protein
MPLTLLRRLAMTLGALTCLPLAATAQEAASSVDPGAARPASVARRYPIDPEREPRPVAHGTRTTGKLVIDGRLDEADWARAEVLADFVQQLPNTGMPARFPTVVRVLYDADHLYIGAVNHDPEPRKAITTGLERDFQGVTSDVFGLVLDTFLDRRNSFLFLINPHGAVRDEQTFNDSRNVVEAWEGIVTARTTFTDSAWIAEVEIPLKTLRFDAHKGTQDWGVNFIRRVRRVNETSYWSPLERQYRVHRMSKAGTLAGLTGLEQGRNLQIKPFITGVSSGGAQVPVSAQGRSGDGGLDLKYGLSPSLTLDGTINTDFSQVEVDQEQVNLTRFSLFFPERREFFLENAGSFTFGDVQERNYRSGAGLRDFTLFNSRQIGLTTDGRPLPIIGGGRVSGRVGSWEVGLLDMQTQSALGNPAENFGVVRAKRNLLGKSDVGVLLQQRMATDGSGRYNTSYGTDANLRVGDKLILNSYFAASEANGSAADGYAARASVGYRGKLWDNSVMLKRVTGDFNPGLGFVRRSDMQHWYATTGVHARPGGKLQEINPYLEVDYITDLEHQLDTRSLTAGLELFLNPDGQLTMRVEDQFDRLEAPFQVFPGVTIPVGPYGWREASIRYQTGQTRAVFGSVNVAGGEFYSGERRSWGGNVTVRPRYDLSFEASFTRNDVSLPTGAFVADLASLRTRYQWSTRLFGSAFVQYNTQNRAFVTNARLNYRYKALSDVFLVYTERRNTQTQVRNERTLALKVTRMVAF